jgi:hypothetical protein
MSHVINDIRISSGQWPRCDVTYGAVRWPRSYEISGTLDIYMSKKHGTREYPGRIMTVYGADVMVFIQQVRKCPRRCKWLGEYQGTASDPFVSDMDAMEREDRRVSLKQFELECNLSHCSVCGIIHECIGCLRVHSRWMPEHQNLDRMATSLTSLQLYSYMV